MAQERPNTETGHPLGTPTTTFFRYCPLVFQGGGCRAIALAGAYRRAIAAGVHPTRVAGTSAGSIMAALVGAGATPDHIIDTLSGTRFESFLQPPEPIGHRNRPLRLLASGLRICHMPDFAHLLAYGGFHSSVFIETWLNGLLSELLPAHHRPIRFRDLLLPTSVVAADLGSQTVKVWSSDTTPNESVAFAVRASCSIPIFFQPVVQGNSRLVDGGVLSNLPTFVFSKMRDSSSSITPILAFELKGADDTPGDWSPIHALYRLIDTMVGGATDLQVALHPSVHLVIIPTGSIKATDFDSVTGTVTSALITAGDQAMARFIDTEASRVIGVSQDVAHLYSLEELYYELAAHADSPGDEVRIATPDTVWFWKIFSTVVGWARTGAAIEVRLPPPIGSPIDIRRERFRRQILRDMGATVVESTDMPFFGFIFLRHRDKAGNSAVVFGSSRGEHAPLAVRYRGASHSAAISALCELLPRMPRDASYTAFLPDLVHFDWPELRERLTEGVGQYAHPWVSLDMEDVKVSELRPLVRVVRAYKYRQVEHLADVFRERGIPLFDCATIALRDGRDSVVTPPVVEVHGTERFLIEGNTRAHYCSRSGITHMRAIVVRGVREPIPGTSVDLRRVNISTDYLEPSDRMPGLNYSLFRHVEAAAHPLP